MVVGFLSLNPVRVCDWCACFAIVAIWASLCVHLSHVPAFRLTILVNKTSFALAICGVVGVLALLTDHCIHCT